MKLYGRNIKISIIDVGTNNILLLLAQKKRKIIDVIERRSSISALGKNMKDHLLTQSAIRRTKNILNDFISYSRFYTENIIIIGTSCSREAKNIELLSNWLWKKHHLKYLIISGDEEAYFNGLANMAEFPELKEFILFDIGGGSTEFTYIRNKKIEKYLSIDLGIRRLQNEFGKDLLNKEAQSVKLLKKLAGWKKKIPLVGIGGTVTSLTAMKLELKHYDGVSVHKTNITIEELERIYKKILRLSYKDIAALIPFDPKRSDIILTGSMIVKKIINFFKAEDFFVSDRGFQFGILNLSRKDLIDLYSHVH
jgi:exopolyphosphatase / guanosine-5'-triphosphate,3'-diphosphate pyrophosphatase